MSADETNLSPAENTSSIYLLNTYTDRERLYNQYIMMKEYFNERFDAALHLGNLPTDPATANWRVLDLGSGEGLLSGEIFGRYPHASIVGLDRDPEAILTGNMIYGSKGDLHFYVHDLLQPFPALFKDSAGESRGDGFDIAFSWWVLMHIKEADKVLAQAFLALKPGGVISLGDVINDWMRFPHPSMVALTDCFEEAWRLTGGYSMGDRHADELEKVGFTQVQSIAYDQIVGGPTEQGRQWLGHMVSTLDAVRPGLVDRLKLMSPEEFDLHIHRLRTESTPDMVGRTRVKFTIARKPLV